jgi:alpha-beta hydrolase superfamily lysophospholipase
MSFRLYPEILDAGEYAIARAAKITLPTLLLIAGDDKIVSAQAEREFARNGGKNITVKEFEGGYHSLHSDIIRDEVLRTMLDFLDSTRTN